MGVSENSVPLNPMVLLIIIPFLNGYFIGNINPTFSDKPILPSGYVKIAIENGPVEIVSFPTNSMVIFHCKMLVYQRVNLLNPAFYVCIFLW